MFDLAGLPDFIESTVWFFHSTFCMHTYLQILSFTKYVLYTESFYGKLRDIKKKNCSDTYTLKIRPHFAIRGLPSRTGNSKYKHLTMAKMQRHSFHSDALPYLELLQHNN